jgi:hypothetical protein
MLKPEKELKLLRLFKSPKLESQSNGSRLEMYVYLNIKPLFYMYEYLEVYDAFLFKDMMKNKKLTLNNIFRGGVVKSDINDDIYDRWHNSKVNEGFDDDTDGMLESQAELPKNSDVGYYYWIGKDYANSYKEDFKDVHEYMKGMHLHMCVKNPPLNLHY